MNYYDFHIGDYTSRTAHLEPMEDLAFRRLLDLYYLREGALPADVREVSRLIRLRGMEDVVGAVLAEFFMQTADGWVNAKCEDVIAKARAAAERARQNGTKGGRPRKPEAAPQETPEVLAGNPEETQPVISGNPEKSDSKAPTSHFPLPSYSDPIGSGAAAPLAPTRALPENPSDRDMVFALGVPLLTAAGVSEKNARSMLAQLSKQHGEAVVHQAIRTTADNGAGEPVSYLQRVLGKGAPRLNPQEALEASNREVARRWAERNANAAA